MEIDDSWHSVILEAHDALELSYQEFLQTDKNYFPSQDNYLNAFNTLKKPEVKYILFGQDPYPREQSASGYAFIDAKVKDIFSKRGLSTNVNKATSLRNFIKMLLVAKGELSTTTQLDIANLDKTNIINEIDELRKNLENAGVLLLNTALIFTDKKDSKKHIKEWRPFMKVLLKNLATQSPKLIMFGLHAKNLKRVFDLSMYETIELEHPYNHSFITNTKAHNLFAPMHLLK